MSNPLLSRIRTFLISTVILSCSFPALAMPPSTQESSTLGSSFVAESSLFTPYAGLRLIPAFMLYQPLYRSNRVNLFEVSNLEGSSKFNELYPSVAASLRIQSGFWWAMPYIGGPTADDETAISTNVIFNQYLARVALARTVYGGLMIGRDLFRINPFSPLESLAIISSAESASYGSSLLSQGLVIGMGLGFRVVGDELELDIQQNGSNSDDSVNVEPVGELYARYLFENNIEISTGVKVAMVEGRDVRVGNFIRAETDDDVDVNYYLSIGYNFGF